MADWQCKILKKKYWHCSDYDIEIIDVCALSGDIILLLIMKIQTSEQYSQGQWFVLLHLKDCYIVTEHTLIHTKNLHLNKLFSVWRIENSM